MWASRQPHTIARTLCIAVALFAAACGGDSSPPAAPSTGGGSGSSGGVVNVTGTEKVGWDQVVDNAAQLAHFRYLGFVDSVSQVLADAVCGTTAVNGAFPCSASLPKMTAGMHAFQIATEEIDGAQR